jgi:hypothetical protein
MECRRLPYNITVRDERPGALPHARVFNVTGTPSPGSMLRLGGTRAPANGVVKAILVNHEESLLTMHVAISPVGLGLHVIFCLIYYVPHAAAKSRRFPFHTGTAIGIIGFGLLGSAASVARPSRARPTPNESQAGYYSLPINHRCPPSGAELKNRPIVKKILDDAWRMSNYGAPRPQEVGGWLYEDKHGRIYARYQESRFCEQFGVHKHGEPPLDLIPGDIVALFHTHPNPSQHPDPNKRYAPGPTEGDVELAIKHKVPGLIRSDRGIEEPYGPERGKWDEGPVNCSK